MRIWRVDFSRPVCVVVTVLLLTASSCGRPYAGASEASYAIATSLVTISSRELTEKLDDVEQLIVERLATDELTEREATYLREIIAEGREGRWDAAEQQARQVLADQVER